MPKIVTVTGANGFVGKNLIIHLERMEGVEVLKVSRETSESDLKNFLLKSDAVVHLAGSNRPKYEGEYQEINVDFTDKIASILKDSSKCKKIIYSSSQKVHDENDYGNSKKGAEDVLINTLSTAMNVTIFRYTNIFGKWSRPFYNSVVSTFCHQIARNESISISDPANIVNLVYIEDVIASILAVLGNDKTTGHEVVEKIEGEREITLGELSSLVKSFGEIRRTSMVPDFADSFVQKLYATYTSYLPEDSFAYDLELKTDNRGDLFEIIKSPHFGQMFFSTTRPGITRGNHYHHTKIEKFIVVKGEALIKFRRIDNDEVIEYRVTGGTGRVVDIPIGYTHSITNIGSEDMLVLFYSTEVFNPEKPDTYFKEV